MHRYFVSLLSVVFVFCAGCWNFRSSVEIFDITAIKRDESVVPVLILGGGCAGLYAAVYCAQANIPCVVIEGPKPGGSLAQSHSVRNWPGVINQPGADIVNSVRLQAQQNNVRIVPEKIVSVDMFSWPRVITTQSVDQSAKLTTYKALSVIVALGTEPNLLGVSGETGPTGYWGRGVSNCAVCEGSLYNGKNVAIVGGGDAAIVEADYMAGIAAQVTLLLRSNVFRTKDIQARDRVLAKPNIRVLCNTEVVEVKGDGNKMTHVMLLNNTTGKRQLETLDGLFLAIGSKPNTALLKGQVALDGQGLIALTTNQETSKRGVFAAGDVCDAEFMQGATALGDACKAALQARNFLKEIGFDTIEWNRSANKPTVVKALVSEHPREITSNDDFEKYVMQSKRPVVIDLFATWCIPCQQMLPVVDDATHSLQGRVVFVTMNIQNKVLDVQTLVKRLGGVDVQGVPTFLCVMHGKEIGRFMGAMSLDTFVREITATFKIT